MTTSHTTHCPLCNELCEVRGRPNFGRYTAVACQSCGTFVFSSAAQEILFGMHQNFKDSLKRLASSATQENILLITTEPVGNGGGLKPELVARSSIRL